MEFSSVSMLVPVTLAGAAVGVVAGLFGVGGGFLLVPVLNIVLRIPMELAVGAGACQVLGPATTSLLARRVAREHLRLPLTIAGGLFRGLDRPTAARFSFLMAVPIMIGASLVAFRDMFAIRGAAAVLPIIAVGFVTSALVAGQPTRSSTSPAPPASGSCTSTAPVVPSTSRRP